MNLGEFMSLMFVQAHAYRFVKNPPTYGSLIFQFHIEQSE